MRRALAPFYEVACLTCVRMSWLGLMVCILRFFVVLFLFFGVN